MDGGRYIDTFCGVVTRDARTVFLSRRVTESDIYLLTFKE